MKPPFPMKMIVVLLLMGFLLEGCALWNSIFGESQEEEKLPAQLMSEGLEDYERGFYENATSAFEKVKDRYPYSQFAVEAELKLADTLFMRGRFAEALESYAEFEQLHPKNPAIPYVIYQQGMCHFMQSHGVDRDQSEVRAAKEHFDRLIKKFPNSQDAQRAGRKIRECTVILAGHELYVGRFYYQKRKYRAALARFRYIVENYPDLGHYHEALEYMAKCREKIPEEDAEATGSWLYRLMHPIY